MRALAFLKNVPIHQNDLNSPWSKKQTREEKTPKASLSDNSPWVFCRSSEHRGTACLCFRLSFQSCVFRETLERHSVSPLKLGCLVSSITKAVCLHDGSQAGLLPIRKTWVPKAQAFTLCVSHLPEQLSTIPVGLGRQGEPTQT